MPRTGYRSSPALRIELDDAQPVYLPGDILEGKVIWDEPPAQRSPHLYGRLKFFARAKTKHIVKRQNATSIERGRAVFFEQQLVFQPGKLPDPKNQTWQFSLTIPTASSPGFAARGDTFRQDRDYLSTQDVSGKEEVDVTKHPLPSVMYYFSESNMSGKTVEAYIEYVLVAEMGGQTASVPLYIRQRSIPSPITDYKLRTRGFPQTIKTLKLLPEHADKPLTFSQQSIMFFRRSKTPRYSFTVHVEYPTVVQLEHPDPIPLKVYIVPNINEKDTSIYNNDDTANLPDVRVISTELKLIGIINIRCPGTFWDSDTSKTHNFPFQFPLNINPITIPIITEREIIQNSLPTPNQKSAQFANGYMNISGKKVLLQSGQFDLGEKLSILLGCSAGSTAGRPPISFKRQVYPTFTTYNIAIKYRLQWTIRFSCAGEEKKISIDAPIVILAPSEEQEEQKIRELGTAGMRKNYDDMEATMGTAIQFIGTVLQAVAGG